MLMLREHIPTTGEALCHDTSVLSTAMDPNAGPVEANMNKLLLFLAMKSPDKLECALSSSS